MNLAPNLRFAVARGLLAFHLSIACWAAHAAQSTEPQRHVQAYYDALNQCAGSSDPTVQQKYCAARDQESKWLRQHGWCYGPKDAPSYQQRWAPCAPKGVEKKAPQPEVKLAAPMRSASNQDWVGSTFVGDSPGWYRYVAQQCMNGDRISCEQANNTAQSLRSAGWCTSGTESAPCPGYVLATPDQWKAHLAALERKKPRPKLDPNNPYARELARRLKDMNDWAAVQEAINPY
ncbi:Uncharacterised protein [Bordetella ansorpii]|uniref:Lipoprotein n=1 Tax=Bordetella ansorpii TaxID=288768 RepID=A0A157S6C7_9BORD|nr:hypothetical protein [Bordetella ansorpii]SAI65486.1 Uncharacterised protein [Bordetella ansorpii]